MFQKSCFAAALVAAMGATLPALAQSDAERAGARAAASQGEAAFDQGRYADAIDMFTRAEKLVHAPPHLLFLARSHSKLGQLVEAREIYIKINIEELGASAPQAFRDAQATAKRELAALEPRIPYVTVTVQGAGAEDPRVLMDGQRVPDALVGVPYPMNPGKHVFQAFANGMESSENTVTVKEGGRDTLVLTLQAAGAAGAAPAATPAAGGAEGEAAPPPEDTGEADTGGGGGISGMRIGSYVAYGVGGVGLITGIVFMVRKSTKNSEADSLFGSCVDRGCTPPEQDEIARVDDQATTAGTIGVIGLVAGGLGIAAGTVLLVMDLNSSSDTAALELRDGDFSVQPWASYQSAGLTGTF
jgi:hypothetical protein